jgi:hypothetical protein
MVSEPLRTKANAISDAALEGLAGAVLSGPGLSKAKSLAGKATAPARKFSAGVARTFADIVDPAERAAIAAAKEAPAPAAAKAASAASRPILKAPSFLEGDMGMESIPRLAPGSEYTANIPGRREFFMEQIADPNSALAPRFVDKLAKTPGGIDALIEGPSSNAAKDAVKALKAKLEPSVQETSTVALNAPESLEQVVNTVASSADNATKAAAAHKLAMMRSRAYADAYKNAK